MPVIRTRLILPAALSALGVLLCLAVGPPPASAAKIKFVRDTTHDFDQYTCGGCSSLEQRRWMRNHYWRMRAVSPWFDSSFGRSSAIHWSSPAHAYLDLYAIYREDTPGDSSDAALLARHPRWVLRDGPDNPRTRRIEGRRLYIPWGCGDPEPGCPQFAADVGSRAFRRWWIDRARRIAGRGYAGIHVDDVNMDFRVSDGNGNPVRPWDPRTGRRMTLAHWRSYVATFTERIRAALGRKEIVHNAFYWPRHSDPYVRRQNRAATLVELERGFDDPNLTGASARRRFSYRRVLAHVSWLHRMGKSVLLEPYFDRPMANGDWPPTNVQSARREHEIAAYYLVRARRDAIASDFQSDPPGSGNAWSAAWNANLGRPLGPRYRWRGVLRRNFTRGFVVVNLPESPWRTLSLGGRFRRLSGAIVRSVTLRRTPLPWQSPQLSPGEEGVTQGAVLFKP